VAGHYFAVVALEGAISSCRQRPASALLAGLANVGERRLDASPATTWLHAWRLLVNVSCTRFPIAAALSNTAWYQCWRFLTRHRGRPAHLCDFSARSSVACRPCASRMKVTTTGRRSACATLTWVQRWAPGTGWGTLRPGTRDACRVAQGVRSEAPLRRSFAFMRNVVRCR